MKIKINESTYKKIMKTLLSEDGIEVTSDIPMLEELTPEQDEDKLEVMKRKLSNVEPQQTVKTPKFQTLSQFAGDGWIEKYLDKPTDMN
jgi:hypothetical protein